ncbi:hypothetical protein Q7P37_003495 [Cladosporium fusiforme]
MPAAASREHQDGAAGPDDLDALLDYDEAVDDFWKDLPDANSNNANDAPQAQKDMDEEVKMTKKRKPNPKLDEERLLSSAGIPKLRKITKDRLRFKGKGHEFSDISRMLNLYQLWLDDLYPKAKFRDALTMVEKVGHTKRMQVSRRAWIDESKGFRRREDEDAEMRLRDLERQASAEDDAIFPVPSTSTKDGQRQQSAGEADAPDDDELDALLAEEPMTHPQPSVTGQPKPQGLFQDDDEPDEDELDALLNENPTPRPVQTGTTKQKGPFEDDEDDQDELDMLLAAEPQHQPANANGQNASHKTDGNSRQEPDFAEDEEAMAEMGW